MSFSFIHQLLDNGVSEEEILASLTKQIPSLARKASRMFTGGWSPRQVLDSFSQDKDVQKSARRGLKPVTPGEIASMRLRNSYDNIPQSQGKESREALTNFTKKAAPIALTALGTQMAGPVAEAAMGRALPHVSNLLKTVLGPQTTSEGTLLPTPLNSESIPVTNSKLNPSQPPVNAPSIPQVPNTVQPEGISSTSIEPNKLTGLANMLSPGDEKSQEEAEKLAQRLTKNSTVIAPQGVGEVKEIRNGKAIVEIDGKRHQIDESELESSPIPEKDLADLYDELIEGIEGETGEDVSRMVQWAGYNPETNTLQFLPHTGKLYKYGNISEEDAALLTDILSTRKTSGSNFIGAWKAGSKSPIGAALSKLIRKLQSERGGKGNEYEETHEPIYSAYEPAIEAKKRKKKNK